MVRLASGIVMAAVAIAAIVWLPQLAFRAAITGLAAAAAAEYAPLAGRRAGLGRWLVVLVVALSTWLLSERPFNTPLVAVLGIGIAAGFVLGRGRAIPSSLAALFGVVYIGIPFALLAHLRAVAGWRSTLLLVVTVVVSDSLQYYSGRLFGRRPLAPTISPKKTIEGAIGGVAAAALFLAAAAPLVLSGLSRAAFAGVGVMLSLAGICGDLFESQLKRTAGIKDSSDLIPGHGGVLDRVDALLFATPVFYVLVRSVL